MVIIESLIVIDLKFRRIYMELRGLIVREPFATMIVTGIKKWEIRKRNTRIRGPILIISNSVIKGVVDLYDVTGPYSADELNKFFAFHRVPSNFLKRYCKGQRVFVWKLRNPVKFAEEIKNKDPERCSGLGKNSSKYCESY